MSEEEVMSVEEESSVAVAPAEESPETQEAPQETQAQRRERNDAEYNWAEMRRQKRELERRVAELESRKPEPVQEDSGVKDDDFVEGKHFKNLQRKLEQLEADLKRKEASTVDERLSFKFPDYATTVNEENLELLSKTEPELYQELIEKKGDPYKQSLLAYKYIKNFVPQRDSTMTREKKNAIENSKKPVSVQAVARGSAVANANLFADGPLTKERKEAIYKQMLQDMKGY